MNLNSSGPSYRVFLGASSKSDIHNDASGYRWQTVASEASQHPRPTQSILLTQHPSYSIIPFPPATLEAASRRITLVYKDFLLNFSKDFGNQPDEGELDLIESFVASQQGRLEESILKGDISAGGDEQPPKSAGRDKGGVFEREASASTGLSPNQEPSVLQKDQTTLYTWPPTPEEPERMTRLEEEDEEQEVQESLEVEDVEPYPSPPLRMPSLPDRTNDTSSSIQLAKSMLRDESASNILPLCAAPPSVPAQPIAPSPLPGTEPQGPTKERSVDLSFLQVLQDDSARETQQTQSTNFEESYATEHTNASSMAVIGRFPHFHFDLHTIAPLSRLSNTPNVPNPRPNAKNTLFYGGKGAGPSNNSKAPAMTRKVDLLLAILEVDGPDKIKMKKGAQAGSEISILKLVLGDEDGSVCRLTAWRETADDWGEERPLAQLGQIGQGEAVKRGDIVHLSAVMATCEPGATVTLSASPHLGSKLLICYRTMPYTLQDNRLRPDLRLGDSEPCVRKVARVVKWFESMAGLA